MTNLAGHDLPALRDAFRAIDHDRPTCFICYTIKGFGLPFAGHKDNHAGLMTQAQVEVLRTSMGVRPDHEWEKSEGLSFPASEIERFLAAVPFAARRARHGGDVIEIPADLPAPTQPVLA